MKKTLLIPFFVAALAFAALPALLLIGCAGGTGGHPTTVNVSGNPTNVNAGVSVELTTNITAGVTGSVDPTNPSNWTAGIVITFKQAPNEDQIAALQLADGQSLTRANEAGAGTVWLINRFDFKNPKHIAAMEVAQSAGATWTAGPALKQ